MSPTIIVVICLFFVGLLIILYEGFVNKAFGAESIILLYIFPIAILLAVSWGLKPYYTPEEVPWNIEDKYYHVGRYSAMYYVELERCEETGSPQQEIVQVTKEEWDQCKIGETCMYANPEEVISNWSHLKTTLKEAFNAE